MTERNDVIKCPRCTCIFCNSSDLQAHLTMAGNRNHADALKKAHEKIDAYHDENSKEEFYELVNKIFDREAISNGWAPGKYGGELRAADKEPFYVKIVNQNGGNWTTVGVYKYKLTTNKQLILRKRADET